MKNLSAKIFLTLLLALPVSLSAYDFSLAITANGGFGNAVTEDNAFDFNLGILPGFSTLAGDNGEFTLSAGFTLKKEEELFFIPELLRAEFNIRFGNSGISVGRVNYSDPLSFIADGFFDGVQYRYNSAAGTFRAGAWYTGLQYKERANIVMTEDDLTALSTPVDYNDFFKTYFASKRAFASVGWEHPSVGEFLHLNTAVIGQFDLNGTDTEYDSQYVILKAGVPISNLLIEIGGGVEFAQTADDENKYNMAFAGEIGLFLLIPSKFNSRLSFTGLITSGRTDDTVEEFIPITGKTYGYILKSRMPGLSVFSLNYSSKFSDSLSGSFTASYFARNDLETFIDYPASAGGEGYFLGPEASLRVTWSPASDLQFILGGGAFFPSLGDAGQNEKVKWRVDLSVIMSLL